MKERDAPESMKFIQPEQISISNKCFIRCPAMDMRQIMVLRLCCQGFEDGVQQGGMMDKTMMY
jgi:hypothetical protein